MVTSDSFLFFSLTVLINVINRVHGPMEILGGRLIFVIFLWYSQCMTSNCRDSKVFTSSREIASCIIVWGASLVAQMAKNPSAVQETQVQSLDWEDPWRREWLLTPVFFPGEFHAQKRWAGYSPWGRMSWTWHSS